jgi:hypothetical protein
MPLLGQAAMLLTFDVVDEAIAEHDGWHTHEHLPERLAIPGFLRGTRWVTNAGSPRYMVLYEVDRLETLSSAAYLERLNNPSAWTRKMMPHYRGMSRGLCSVVRSVGYGMGGFGLLVRFTPGRDDAGALESAVGEAMTRLAGERGIGSLHLLRGAAAAEMTSEQRIRGVDSGVDWALLATGYSQGVVERLAQSDLGAAALEGRGATAISSAAYQCVHSLSAQEAGLAGV